MADIDVVYLNLVGATARREAFLSNYASHDFASHWRLARFQAIDAAHDLVRTAAGTLSPGNKGCIFSSLECLREHFDTGRHLYILDDDIVFAPTAQSSLDLAFTALDEDSWDILLTDTIIPNAFDMPRLMMQRYEHGITGELALWNMAAPGFTFCAGSTVINHRAKRKIHALMTGERYDAPWDLVMRQHIQAGRVRAVLVFPFLTAASRLGDESQIKPDNPHRLEESLRNAFRRMLWLGDMADSTDDQFVRFNAIMAPLLAIQTRQRWFRRAA
jgi:GR25 family glycosyltransferase involved in LPS biosynthesis